MKMTIRFLLQAILYFSLVGLTLYASPALCNDQNGITESHHMIPMRDGVRLSAWIYVPEGDGPWPVLMEQRYSNVRGGRKRYAQLAKAGYVVAGVNFRGTDKSEGTFVGYHDLAWGEKQDGYDITEWLAKQDWSNGKVGAFGSSQAGFAQNLQAVAQPPSLVCQFMVDTGLSLFHDGYRMGGATRYVQFRAMEKFCREPEDNHRLVKEWTQHPTYDDYWAAEDAAQHFNKMNVPCFTLASWLDDPKGDSSIRSFIGRQHQGGENSRGKQQMVIGPWPHGGAKNNVVGDLIYPKNATHSIDDQMLRWFGYYLQGKETGVTDDPAVRYYVMGATGEPGAPGNVWRNAQDFPPKSRSTSYFLQPQGMLNQAKPDISASEPKDFTEYLSDPQKPAKMPSLVSKNMESYERDPGVITFSTSPLKEPVEWTGQVQAELFVSSTAPDTDFIVKVCDVYPDGRSIALINSVLRAQYREGFDKQVPLEQDKIAKLKFDIGWLSQIFNTGHRIRITIASTGAPYYEPNPQTGLPITSNTPDKTQTARNRIFHSPEHPSRIMAPVMQARD